MSRQAILVTAPALGGQAPEMLAEAGYEVVYSPANTTEAELVALARKVQEATPIAAIISRSIPLGAEIMDTLPSLRVLSKHGVGYDNIDIEAARARGLAVTRTSGMSARSVAEMAMALILAAARNLRQHDEATAAGEWDRMRWQGEELERKSLGVLGFGTIGRELIRLARPFFAEIVVADPVAAEQDVTAAGASLVPLAEMFRRADVLSLHCPLVPETQGILSADTLAALPAGAIVVNTARGPLVDEAALVAGLNSGHIAAAGLDTHAVERPNDDQALRRHPHVISTPHIGGSTRQALEKVAECAAGNALSILGHGGAVAEHDLVVPAR